MKYTPKNHGVTALPPLWLLDQVRDRLRVRHYSLQTEQTHLRWMRRFILTSGKRHPAQMGPAKVEAFLFRLATDAQVTAGTQTQAFGGAVSLPQRIAYRSASRSRLSP
ncbi:phage integrase N-terminal SAM-like domain-containing protein [Xanthomonas sp. NCPPB 3582]|uniref:phage integrase N-terminal SAM-like domain-containing protein n=1 Tax=Xanthomonas sp. NCPPB 3582 TaxID=487557 RepID=UPI0035580CE8